VMLASYLGTIRVMSIPSDWIMAATETEFVADGLLLMKVFCRNDKDAASTISAVDVFGGILGGSIFVVLTTF
jgi:hypothetical protein